MERAIAARFGFASDVLFRTGPQWRAALAANPHGEMAERDPNSTRWSWP